MLINLHCDEEPEREERHHDFCVCQKCRPDKPKTELEEWKNGNTIN